MYASKRRFDYGAHGYSNARVCKRQGAFTCLMSQVHTNLCVKTAQLRMKQRHPWTLRAAVYIVGTIKAFKFANEQLRAHTHTHTSGVN